MASIGTTGRAGLDDSTAEPTAAHLAQYEANAGAGLPNSVVEYGVWLCGEDGHLHPHLPEWLWAFEAIDRRQDISALTKLLRSDWPFPPAARLFLADLVERYALKRRKGGQRTPAYERTLVQARLEAAAEQFRREARPRGTSARDEAITKIAAQWGIESEALHNHIDGRRGQSRREMRRHTRP